MLAFVLAVSGFSSTPRGQHHPGAPVVYPDGCMDAAPSQIAELIAMHTDDLPEDLASCRDIQEAGLCSHARVKIACCATCREASEIFVAPQGGGSRGSGASCDKDNQCASGDCGDWNNNDLRCCPHSHGNRWDQCGNIPSGSPCKNWDGSQCSSGRCHDWTCTESCSNDNQCDDACWHPETGNCDPYRICTNGYCHNSRGEHNDYCTSGDHCIGAGHGKCVGNQCRHGAPCEPCEQGNHNQCEGLCMVSSTDCFLLWCGTRCNAAPRDYCVTIEGATYCGTNNLGHLHTVGHGNSHHTVTRNGVTEGWMSC